MKIGCLRIIVAALVLAPSSVIAQTSGWELREGQKIYPVAPRKGLQAHVLVHLPIDFRERNWPVIVYLHGSAQRGAPANELRKTALAKHLAGQPTFPFIVVSPQLAPNATKWDASAVHALLDEVLPNLPIQGHKIYASGTSIGGSGVWRLAFKRPSRFAAIAPVATAERLRHACRIRQTPVWAFHNALDESFPATNDTKLVGAINRCGGTAKMTLYQRTGHDAWTETYSNPALYDWFLSQRSKRITW